MKLLCKLESHVRVYSKIIAPLFPRAQPFLTELGKLLKESVDDEVCVEVLGILGNLLLPEVDFERVVSQLELMPFILAKLKVSGKLLVNRCNTPSPCTCIVLSQLNLMLNQ